MSGSRTSTAATPLMVLSLGEPPFFAGLVAAASGVLQGRPASSRGSGGREQAAQLATCGGSVLVRFSSKK